MLNISFEMPTDRIERTLLVVILIDLFKQIIRTLGALNHTDLRESLLNHATKLLRTIPNMHDQLQLSLATTADADTADDNYITGRTLSALPPKRRIIQSVLNEIECVLNPSVVKPSVVNPSIGDTAYEPCLFNSITFSEIGLIFITYSTEKGQFDDSVADSSVRTLLENIGSRLLALKTVEECKRHHFYPSIIAELYSVPRF